jgi:hypothetical protein
MRIIVYFQILIIWIIGKKCRPVGGREEGIVILLEILTKYKN